MHSYILSLHPDLTAGYLVLFFTVALVIGMTKAGLTGLGLAAVPAMAMIFGAKESTGILLPMLFTADIMAVIYYHRSAVWKHIIRVLPWIAAGIVIALITGNLINENQFRILLLLVVWAMLILMMVNDLWIKKREKIPGNHYFPFTMGLAGGFSTMIGNSGGPVMTLYFLVMRLPKKEFIGTMAWLFLIMNTSKLPLHFFVWKTISADSLLLNLMAVPVIAAGIFAGIHLVKLFTDRAYRLFVIITTLATSLFLFI